MGYNQTISDLVSENLLERVMIKLALSLRLIAQSERITCHLITVSLVFEHILATRC